MKNSGSNKVIRVGINTIQNVEIMSRNNLSVLCNVKLACSIEFNGKDALSLTWCAADQFPPLEEVGLPQLDMFKEFSDHNGQPQSDGLMRPSQKRHRQYWGGCKHLLALDMQELLGLRAGCNRTWRYLGK